MTRIPTQEDLLAVAVFADLFDAPEFVVGEDVPGSVGEDGVASIGWWQHSPTVSEWVQALYEHHIIDPEVDHSTKANAALTTRMIEDSALVADLDLPTLRMFLTRVARSDKFSWGSGLYEEAFASGAAQAATRRLGVLAKG